MSFSPRLWFEIMDPVVDEYNKVKSCNIDPNVKAKASKLTRMFLIRLSLINISIYVIN